MPRKRVDVTVEPATGHAVLPFQFRMKQSLRDALKQAADQHSRSINAEMHARLEASFAEERALGGPALHWLVTLTVSAFTVAARMKAPNNPDPFHDREVYKAGLFAVIDALLAGLPDATPEEIALEIEGLKGRLLSRLANAAAEAHDLRDRASAKRRAG